MYRIQSKPNDPHCEWTTEYTRSSERAAIARAVKLWREYRGQIAVRVMFGIGDLVEVWSA